jgi:hypothetical protein
VAIGSYSKKAKSRQGSSGITQDLAKLSYSDNRIASVKNWKKKTPLLI